MVCFNTSEVSYEFHVAWSLCLLILRDWVQLKTSSGWEQANVRVKTSIWSYGVYDSPFFMLSYSRMTILLRSELFSETEPGNSLCDCAVCYLLSPLVPHYHACLNSLCLTRHCLVNHLSPCSQPLRSLLVGQFTLRWVTVIFNVTSICRLFFFLLRLNLISLFKSGSPA